MFQAFDCELIGDVAAEGAATVDRKIGIASKAFDDRDAWPTVHRRRFRGKGVRALKEEQRPFAMTITSEGGKQPDAINASCERLTGSPP
ncbi:aldehyde dehydrogenase family protein [Rhizobium leguminosarum]|uniref:aldehyde dehydrogenase family protein n=1 Tax=Rhizobium leguminosarum TaxID=384 RepID=UPI000F775701